MKEIVDKFKKALDKQGIDFNKISKDSVLDFLFTNGVPRSKLDIVYQLIKSEYSRKEVKELFDTNSITSKSQDRATSSTTNIETPIKKVTQEPRKNLFGEIKRIA